MTENTEVAKRELTKQILDDLAITAFLRETHMPPDLRTKTQNPSMAIEKYSEYFKKLYKVINSPIAP